MYENNVFDCKEIDKIVREQPLVKPYTPDFNRVWVVPDLGDPIIVSNPRPHAIWTQSHFRWDKIQDPAFSNVLRRPPPWRTQDAATSIYSNDPIQSHPANDIHTMPQINASNPPSPLMLDPATSRFDYSDDYN